MNGSKRGLSFFLAAVAVLFVFGVAPIRGDELVKAAEGGDAEAQFNLGRMYASGEGVPRDYKAAVRWFRKADEQGHKGALLVVDFRNPYTVSWIRVCAYNKVVSPTALGGSRCLDQSRSINPSLRRRRSRKLAGLHDNERHPAPRFTGQRWSWSCRSIRTSRTRSLPRELGSTRER